MVAEVIIQGNGHENNVCLLVFKFFSLTIKFNTHFGF